MRILVLSDHYPPYYKGGHEIRFKTTADGLSRKGHEVFILASKYGVSGKKENDRILRLLNYLEIGHVGGVRKRYKEIKIALLGRQNYFITKKAVQYVKPDIVYAGEISHVSMYPIRAVETYGIPIVHHVGNYYFPQLIEDCILQKNPIKRFYRKAISGFKGIDKYDFRHIITVSEAVKKKYDAIGFTERNIRAIHARGVPPELIAKKSELSIAPETGPIKLLYVGRIEKVKGIHVAIEAVKHLVDDLGVEDIILDIIGEGDSDYIEYLYALIKKLEMQSHVGFRKAISHEAILQEYQKYHILLFPSVWEEPFSGVLIEAMSQGLPIVATNTGGTPELIRDEWNGLLVNPDDPIDMAKAVKRLIENPSLAKRIALNGIDLISEKYNVEKITDKIESYLMDVVSKEKDATSPKLA